MSVNHINTSTFAAALANKTVLVDFWAEWCGPCRMLAPALEEASTELEGFAEIAKVNVDESRELAEKYGIMSIPTMVLFKNGIEAGRIVGLRGKNDIVTFVKTK